MCGEDKCFNATLWETVDRALSTQKKVPLATELMGGCPTFEKF
jgi:hypothetical protein